MLVPFLIAEGARAFKWFHHAQGSDPVDVQAIAHGGFVCQFESERPDLLEVKIVAHSTLATNHDAPIGIFTPVAPGGPFRVSAQLIGPAGDVVAIGGFLAMVCDETAGLPPGDLSLALGPPTTAPAPSGLIEVVSG